MDRIPTSHLHPPRQRLLARGAFLSLLLFTTALSAGEIYGAPRLGRPPSTDEREAGCFSLDQLRPALAPILARKHYRIAPRIDRVGPYAVFTLESPLGTFEAIGLHNLYRLARELEILIAYQNDSPPNEVLRGFRESLGSTVYGAYHLVAHPGKSAREIGRTPARLGRGVARFLTPDPRAGDGTTRTGAAASPLFGGQMRLAAFEYGLDAYSDNPLVQAHLSSIAHRRKAGSLGITAARYASGLEMTGALSLSGRAGRVGLSPDGTDLATEDLIAQYGSDELLDILGELYRADASYNEAAHALQERLLKNRNYSPREQAYIAHHLTLLAALSGREAILARLVEAESPEEAISLATTLELLVWIHRAERPALRLIRVEDLLGLVDREGRYILALPIDILFAAGESSWHPNLLRTVVNQARLAGAGAPELWLSGFVTPQATIEARSLGVHLVPGMIRAVATIDPPAPRGRYHPEQAEPHAPRKSP